MHLSEIEEQQCQMVELAILYHCYLCAVGGGRGGRAIDAEG